MIPRQKFCKQLSDKIYNGQKVLGWAELADLLAKQALIFAGHGDPVAHIKTVLLIFGVPTMPVKVYRDFVAEILAQLAKEGEQ